MCAVHCLCDIEIEKKYVQQIKKMSSVTQHSEVHLFWFVRNRKKKDEIFCLLNFIFGIELIETSKRSPPLKHRQLLFMSMESNVHLQQLNAWIKKSTEKTIQTMRMYTQRKLLRCICFGITFVKSTGKKCIVVEKFKWNAHRRLHPQNPFTFSCVCVCVAHIHLV